MSSGAAIHLEGLVKKYGAHTAVDRISLDIEAGEFVTLLGASGSGKTTTLMMIAGFVDQDEGSIRINDSDIAGLPPERRNLGVVFQSYALFAHMNVYENIAFPLRLRRMSSGEITRKVSQAIELVGLEQFSTRKTQQLSGGQQQRVALARAIVFSPPVLLMDEPLGALDRQLRDQLQLEIKRIQRDLGVTVVYVTHDQEEALALSDRIAIMTDGRIAQLGMPDSVYENPVSPMVARFLGESNLFGAKLLAQNGAHATVALGESETIQVVGRQVRESNDDEIVAFVRPEAIMLKSDKADSPENEAEGRIESREFMGATIRYAVRCPVGVMVVRASRLGDAANFAVGDGVVLSWKRDDTLIFGLPGKD